MSNNLTVEEILNGTRLGRTQTVGYMSVVPIIDDDDVQDNDFDPPDFDVTTSHYGSVNLRNRGDGITIAPTGAGWVTKEHAQDHAIASAALVKKTKTIDTAMCIESSQGGYIRDQEKVQMLVLPAALRSVALSLRREKSYSKLWNAIEGFNSKMGAGHRGHLTDFLKQFEKQLDEFVAEFELVPHQIGAVILIGDRVVGIERAPNVAYWNNVWIPLIRVCYGSLAMHIDTMVKRGEARGINGPPMFRVPLKTKVKSLAGIQRALKSATKEIKKLTEKTVETLSTTPLLYADKAEGSLEGAKLFTVANSNLAGQIVTKSKAISYASLCAAGA